MPLLHLFVIAAVQGITEFLPISSSGHLVLLPHVMNWQDQGLIIDVAGHAGTLLAVCLYYIRDLLGMGRAILMPQRKENKQALHLFFYLVIATIPVVIIGYLVKDQVSTYGRNIELVGWTTLLGGLLLYVADKISMTVNRLSHLTWVKALFIGCMQVLALLPGTSRSGITVTAARFLGFERRHAAHFSMLLSIPTILGAVVLTGIDLQKADNIQLTQEALMVGALTFVFALLSIWILLGWLKNHTFGPFVIYRVVLGCTLLYWVYAVHIS